MRRGLALAACALCVSALAPGPARLAPRMAPEEPAPEVDPRRRDPDPSRPIPPVRMPVVDTQDGQMDVISRLLRDRILLLGQGVDDDVANVLSSHPELLMVKLAGHTDSRGTEEANLDLSFRRARSVLEALVSRGIERERLVTQGWGESRPLVEEKTEKEEAINRRVEFLVTQRAD